MLSIPGFKGLMKINDARKNHGTAPAELLNLYGEGTSDISSYLLYLAERLDMSLLALIEAEPQGEGARIRAAGRDGLISMLKVPTLDSDGQIAGLINRAAPQAGKARVFSRHEVFPEDGAWCDLIPMDSEVAFVFVPIAGTPFEDWAGTGEAPCRVFLLAAGDPGSDDESLLPLKAMLSASLVGFSLTLKRRRNDRRVLAVLRDLLKEEGYSIGFADAAGRLVEKDGSAFGALKTEAIERLERELASQGSEAGGEGSKPKAFAAPEGSNLEITIYPVTPSSAAPGHMVVVKECDFASKVRTRKERLKLLSRFISSIAHEIKNPLTGISAGVQYLAKKIQPGVREEETVDFILNEINRLNRIVDDLYKAAKPPKLELQEIDLNDVAGRSLICLSEDVTRRRLAVSQNFDKALTEFEADPDRLQQVLINIIKNAIEASPEGGTIHIETSLQNGRATIRVTDEGEGIGPEDSERIFEPFYSTKDRGSGLGLCISQRIIDEHGGTIRVEAPDGGGTRFVIELPTGR